MSSKLNAILSASNKEGLVEFASFLKKNQYEIYATSGTKKFLNENGIDSIDISEITGIPEMFDGRLKTLSSYVLGGILSKDRNDSDLAKYHMIPIDLVMVSLYDFIGGLFTQSQNLIDLIDIGGVTLLRSAAKNFQRVIVVPGNEYMNFIMERMKNGQITLQERRYLANITFHLTSYYDYAISEYFGSVEEFINFGGKKFKDLRYGENPHQKAGLYYLYEPFFKILKEGKELSYNNILDSWNAWELVNRLDQNSSVVVKHNIPCGAATGPGSLMRAYEGDEVSAYGGIIATNMRLSEEEANFLSNKYVEVIIAPDYDEDALRVLNKKKNLRVLKGNSDFYRLPDIRTAGNLILRQDWNYRSNLKFDIISGEMNEKLEEDLKFGWEVLKSLRSNAIIIVKNLQLRSAGSGQPNRVDAVELALNKAKKLNRLDDPLLISDGFFPFKDSLELIKTYGVNMVAAPMGSIRDPEIIDYAKSNSMTFIRIGERAFKH